MKQYLKNILRNVIKNKTSYLGAIAVISLGVLIYIAMADVLFNLKGKINLYYENYHFAGAFATVTGIPENKLNTLKEVEGVDEVFGRLSADARLMIEGQNNIVTLHLLAYDSEDCLNQIKLSPSVGKMNEDMIYLGSKMNHFYGFNQGDSLKLVIGNRTKSFTLSGTLQTPEYIYSVPPSGVQLPDDEIYDIACIDKRTLENLLDRQQIVTELGFTLKAGYSFEKVKYELQKRLDPYGLTHLTDQKNQLSNKMISDEYSQLTAMATILPFIFLVISMFMLYIILKKMIASDRSLIGTLKAFGFTDSEILKVYLAQSIIIGALGSLLGGFLSTFLGKFLFGMYSTMYNLPYNHYECAISNQVVGFILALGTSLLSTYLGVREVLIIKPAEAMRAEAPAIGKQVKLLKILDKTLNSRQKMGLRAIFRNKFRSLTIALAVAFPFAFLGVLNSCEEACDQVLCSQFTKIQTYNLKVSLKDFVKYNEAFAAGQQIEGAYHIDVVAEYAPLFSFKNRSEYSTLTVLAPKSPVWHVMDYNDKMYAPLEDGLLMNSALAKKLGVKSGDTIQMTSTYFSPEPIDIPVIQVVEESVSGGCYLSMNAIQKYFNITPMANAICFNCLPEKVEAIKSSLSESLNVSSVTDTARALKSYKTMMKSMMQMINVFGYFSIVTAIILIYNISNINLRERKNEFGTLIIMGSTWKEITEIIMFEQIINFILGIMIGFPSSIILKQIVQKAIFSESYTLELKITLADYIYAFCVCLVVMAISLLIIIRNMKKTNPTDVLKERE